MWSSEDVVRYTTQFLLPTTASLASDSTKSDQSCNTFSLAIDSILSKAEVQSTSSTAYENSSNGQQQHGRGKHSSSQRAPRDWNNSSAYESISDGRTIRRDTLMTNPHTSTTKIAHTRYEYIRLSLNRRPIIIVPKAQDDNIKSTRWQMSLIHYGNCKEFLQDGHFSTHSELPSGNQSRLTITHKIEPLANPMKFQVVESSTCLRFNSKDWEAVVAVCLSGEQWQIRDWQLGNTFNELCTNVKCFFFTYENAPIPKLISDAPNVCVLQFSRSFRHSDGAVSKAFWDAVAKSINEPPCTQK